MDPEADQLREICDDALKLIRFPIMSSEEFALEVVPTRILTHEESTLIFQHHVVSPDNRLLLSPLPFSSKKRLGSIYTANFYESIGPTPYVDISAGWFNK